MVTTWCRVLLAVLVGPLLVALDMELVLGLGVFGLGVACRLAPCALIPLIVASHFVLYDLLFRAPRGAPQEIQTASSALLRTRTCQDFAYQNIPPIPMLPDN